MTLVLYVFMEKKKEMFCLKLCKFFHTYKMHFYLLIHHNLFITPGIKLQGDWGEIVALEGSKSPWEAQRVTKTSPSVFATFEKASTCAKQTFCWEKSSEK